jgi:hypothetical protein
MTSTITTSTDTATTDETTTTPVSFEKGSWQESMAKSTVLKERAGKATKQAGVLLWTGAKKAIEEWIDNSENDESGENLYAEAKTALGVARKGEANKIKTVAVAVKEHGLVLGVYPSLTKAYAEAVRLTKTVAAQADEDDAAEKAVESIDDALGKDNEAAHRAFLRAVSTEIAARVQAKKPKPAPKAPKQAKGAAKPASGSSPKAAVKTATAKPKAKPVPVSKSKGDPNARALPPKQASKGTPVGPVSTDEGAAPEVPVATKAKAKPVVIKR